MHVHTHTNVPSYMWTFIHTCNHAMYIHKIKTKNASEKNQCISGLESWDYCDKELSGCVLYRNQCPHNSGVCKSKISMPAGSPWEGSVLASSGLWAARLPVHLFCASCIPIFPHTVKISLDKGISCDHISTSLLLELSKCGLTSSSWEQQISMHTTLLIILVNSYTCILGLGLKIPNK